MMPDLKGPGAKTLAGVLGSVAGAIALLTMVPAEESGRKVAVTIAPSGAAAVRHVSGRLYLAAYLDAVRVPTICDGLTAGVKLGQVLTEAQCDARLQAELVDTAGHVVRCVPALRGRANQAAAAVSLAYNIGWPKFCRSTVARRFNAGAWTDGCDAFPMWNKATRNGQLIVLRGLVDRRARERALCRTGLPV